MQLLVRSVVLSASLLTVVACSNDRSIANPEPANRNQGIVAGTLEIKAANATLTLRNTTESTVGYMVIDKDQAVVLMYPPCGSRCPTIVPGGQASIRFADIDGFTSASTEAIVLWWAYTRAEDGMLRATGAVFSTRVAL